MCAITGFLLGQYFFNEISLCDIKHEHIHYPLSELDTFNFAIEWLIGDYGRQNQHLLWRAIGCDQHLGFFE